MGRNVIKGVEEREKPLFRRGWADAGGKYWGLSHKYIKIIFFNYFNTLIIIISHNTVI